MKTSRPVSINNSLSTGFCNFNCSLCGINKDNYKGPKAYQDEQATKLLINRIRQAAQEGIKFRVIANSGSGEPTLHPEFENRIFLFGDMIREWPAENEVPEVSIVTNGSNLLAPNVISALTQNPITVNISFPSANEERYLTTMFGSNREYNNIFSSVVKGIDKILGYQAEGKIKKVCFHISPPIYDVSTEGFADTIFFLCERAYQANLKSINIVMFPNISNRTGLINSEYKECDSFLKLFNFFNKRKYYNVQINIESVWNRFFRFREEIEEMVKVFKYPCIWNANLFITAEGDSVCCNDQGTKCKMGNIFDNSIEELITNREELNYSEACSECNQRYSKVLTSDEIIYHSKLNFADGR